MIHQEVNDGQIERPKGGVGHLLLREKEKQRKKKSMKNQWFWFWLWLKHILRLMGGTPHEASNQQDGLL